MDAQTGGRCSQGVLSLAGRACRKKRHGSGMCWAAVLTRGSGMGRIPQKRILVRPLRGTSLILRYPPCPGFAVGVVPLAVVCRWEAPGKAQAASLAVWASTSHQFGMQGKGATSSAWWNRRDLREPRAPGGGTAGILRRLVEEGVGPHCANEPQCCCRGPVTPTPHTSPVPCRSHGCLGGRGHLAFVLQSRCVLHGARGRQRRAAPGRSAWGLPRAARRRATRCRPCSA